MPIWEGCAAVLACVLVLMALVSYFLYRRPRWLPNDTDDMPMKHQMSSKNAHLSADRGNAGDWGAGG